MSQIAIDFASEAYRHVARREFVLRMACQNRERFRPDFQAWLEKHMALWERYELEANRVWESGRRHYSSRTLWEVMRHHTSLAEVGSEFKLNNNWAPCLARLYLVMYPDREGFFETREAA